MQDSTRIVGGSGGALCTEEREYYYTMLVAYPSHLLGHLLIKSTFVTPGGFRRYSRIGVKCPLADSTHKHMDKSTCGRYRSLAPRSCKKFGSAGPLAFLGCWLEYCTRADVSEKEHRRYIPDNAEMAAFIAAHDLHSVL